MQETRSGDLPDATLGLEYPFHRYVKNPLLLDGRLGYSAAAEGSALLQCSEPEQTLKSWWPPLSAL
jgi:hypothetical protein